MVAPDPSDDGEGELMRKAPIVRKLLTVALVALYAGLAAPAALSVKGRNAELNRCKNDGWQSLYTSTGAPFADQGACVSYVARGGGLTTTITSRSQLDCESLGGTFGADDQTFDIQGFAVLWTCNGNGISADDAMSLDSDCNLDGGLHTTWFLVGTEGVSAYTCFA